ncbi:unnamed protein product [Cyprideis torosa]|uniref:Uncharacterized protein n=1 Tax=Cyprideis torosa TaxID=163714 RepID=A0A7R8ZSW3_9CRUS|nr:unnamed protein product [Cyprideis torosa]CAG0902587.1 unnamed protein product [Cyprideis torosa]
MASASQGDWVILKVRAHLRSIKEKLLTLEEVTKEAVMKILQEEEEDLLTSSPRARLNRRHMEEEENTSEENASEEEDLEYEEESVGGPPSVEVIPQIIEENKENLPHPVMMMIKDQQERKLPLKKRSLATEMVTPPPPPSPNPFLSEVARWTPPPLLQGSPPQPLTISPIVSESFDTWILPTEPFPLPLEQEQLIDELLRFLPSNWESMEL